MAPSNTKTRVGPKYPPNDCSHPPTATPLTHPRPHQMLDPPQMVKKPIQICKDIERALDSENKDCLHSVSSYVTLFTSIALIYPHSDLVPSILNPCVMPNYGRRNAIFCTFCFNFHVRSRRLQHCLANRTSVLTKRFELHSNPQARMRSKTCRSQ